MGEAPREQEPGSTVGGVIAPGLAAMMAWPVLGHVPTPAETAGLVIAMTGLVIAVTAPSRAK